MEPIDPPTRLKLVELVGSFAANEFATPADGTFNLPVVSPNSFLVQTTNAKCFTSIVHSSVKLGIFSGDVLFADHNQVKVFSGALCSPQGTTTVAIITTFEYIRIEDTTTRLNPIGLEYMPVQSLFETMSKLEGCDGEQNRQSLSSSYYDQVTNHTEQFLNDLNDHNVIDMFLEPEKTEVAAKIKGGKGGKGGKPANRRSVYICLLI